MADYIKFPHREEKELHKIAKEMSEKEITIRIYDGGNSQDVSKVPTFKETEDLEDVFFSALWTLNWHSQSLTHDKIQAIEDMAEISAVGKVKDINGYNSVYIPLARYIESSCKEIQQGKVKQTEKE